MTKIGLYFNESNTNRFISIQREVIEQLGYHTIEIDSKNADEVIISSNDKPKAIVFNWLENGLGKTSLDVLEHYLHWHRRLLYCKKNSIKIITLFHNRAPHTSSFKRKIISKKFYRYLLNLSDAIVLLTDYSRAYLKTYIPDWSADRIVTIPHPNYIGVYGEDRCPNRISCDKMTILYLGLVRGYKNVDIICEIAKDFIDKPIEFVIRGKVTNKESMERLQDHKPQNVTIIPGFIPDKELGNVLKSSDIILLPYDVNSALNSGTAMLAFSYGKSVICPRIATVLDYPDDLNYLYDYTNRQEHIDRLKIQVLKAYHDWSDDRQRFEDKGNQLLQIVCDKNSKETVSQGYERLFAYLELREK